MAKETSKEKIFFIRVSGITDFDEQCRLQCELQNLLHNLGYDTTSANFSVNFMND